MNADEISKAREIAAKATPGRWNCGVDWLGDDKTSEFVCWITTEGVRIPYGTSVYTATQADKDYVELACNEFPAALDEIERLRKIEPDYNALVDILRSMHYTLRYETNGEEAVIECDDCTEPLGCGHLDGCEYGDNPRKKRAALKGGE